MGGVERATPCKSNKAPLSSFRPQEHNRHGRRVEVRDKHRTLEIYLRITYDETSLIRPCT